MSYSGVLLILSALIVFINMNITSLVAHYDKAIPSGNKKDGPFTSLINDISNMLICPRRYKYITIAVDLNFGIISLMLYFWGRLIYVGEEWWYDKTLAELLRPYTINLIICLAICAAVTIFYFIYRRLHPEVLNVTEDDLKKLVFKMDAYNLNLLAKSNTLSNYLKIAEDHTYSVNYIPEELHVGAVSVGGAISGGAYTTGGYNHVSDRGASGTARIMYGDDPVKKIVLKTAALRKEAKEKFGSRFDGKDTIVLEGEIQYDLSDFDREQIMKNVKTTGYIGSDYAKKMQMRHPSVKEAHMILDWLCDGPSAVELLKNSKKEK